MGSDARANPKRLVVIHAQVINRMLTDNRQVIGFNMRHETMLANDVDKLGVVNALHRRIEKALVCEQLGDMGGLKIRRII